MKINRFPDYDTLCAGVAAEVVEQLRRKPNSLLVFPTGNTPLGLFKKLVALSQSGVANFAQARIVILDEYAGLPANDPRSLTDWLKRELLTPVAVQPENIFGFENGITGIEDQIKSQGGLDLVILGLGPNGHLGFNEPGSPFDSRTRSIDLTPESIKSNAAYWGSEDLVPRQGMTLGLGTLCEAIKIILMVSGASKQNVLSQTLNGKISPALPATVLRHLQHAHVFADVRASHYAKGLGE